MFPFPWLLGLALLDLTLIGVPLIGVTLLSGVSFFPWLIGVADCACLLCVFLELLFLGVPGVFPAMMLIYSYF
jgi:hypothetical protein